MSTGSPASHSLRSRSHALRSPNVFFRPRWEPVRRLESPELLCCRASGCEEHSNFILSCNLIGQRENKSFYVTEIVFWLGFADVGRDPFDQNFRKFRYKIKWNRTFLEIRFEKLWTTSGGCPFFWKFGNSGNFLFHLAFLPGSSRPQFL